MNNHMSLSIKDVAVWVCASLLAITVLSPNVEAQSQAGRTLAQDCTGDLNKYCAAIVPGEGRKVACLISYSDRISPRCRLTAFVAGKVLAENVLRLEKLAFKCSSAIPSLCSDVPIGGGRIYDCLKKNKARLLPDCRNALPQFESQFMRK